MKYDLLHGIENKEEDREKHYFEKSMHAVWLIHCLIHM